MMTHCETPFLRFNPAIAGGSFRGGRRPRPPLLILLLGLTIAILTASVARADSVIQNCGDDTELSSALMAGGVITFNCDGNGSPATIPFVGTKVIHGFVRLDGGGRITLDGKGGFQFFYVSTDGSLDLMNIVLQNSWDVDGGAVYNTGFLALDSATIRNCRALDGDGGAIATYGPVDITRSNLVDNFARNGGAIFARSPAARVSIASSLLSGNKLVYESEPNGRGGAVFANGGASVFVGTSDVYSNSAVGSGGAFAIVDAGTSLTLAGVNVHDNQAAAGGGIFNLGGTLTVNFATLWQNKASVTGGAVKNESGTASLSNVTLSGNSAFGGGGLYNYNATANLTNVTVLNNSAGNIGGGISNSSYGSPHLNLENVIVGDSTAGGNCYFGKGPDSSVTNLSSDATCGFGAGRDDLDLKLGPLEINDGTLRTHLPLPGSPAIDGGTLAGCPSMDERFVSRPYGVSCDVGAVEVIPCAAAPVAPIAVAPANNANVSGSDVLLDWAGPDCVTQYSVVVRKNGKTGRIVYSADLEGTEASASLAGRGHQFAWQVTACNDAGCATGSWQKFKKR
jgi:hypothetical protein